MRTPVLLLMFAAACSPAVESATYAAAGPPRPAGAEVRVYEATRPACAFEEIGWVSGAPRGRQNSPDEVLDAMRARARSMGGDAIVALRTTERNDGAMVVGTDTAMPTAIAINRNVFTGTVVRFTGPGCSV